MTLLNENFSKELQRMSELAGLPKNSINENNSQAADIKNIEEVEKIIKEDDDLLGDIGDLLGDEQEALNSQGGKNEGSLTMELKTAMVLNNLNQYEAAELELSGEYKPFTAGAKPELEKGIKDTVYSKSPVQKLPGGSKEYDRLTKQGLSPETIKNLKKSGLSQTEIDAAIEADKKIKRSAVTWGKQNNDPQTARWQPKQKDASIISYETIEKDGKKLFGISKVGKEQLEFLQRMLSDRPLPFNGNRDIDIESVLLSDWPYKNLVITNSERIIRDFFNKAVIRIIADTLKRTKKNPADSQFVVFVENGVNHAIDQTKNKMYNQDTFNNFGAWFMQIVKNKVIDQLRATSTYKLDRKDLFDRLSNQNTPLVVDSKLNPENAIDGKYTVTTSPFYFKEGNSKKPYFRYTFNDPMDAAPLFVAKSEGDKKSPLRPEFLSQRNKTEFYKSVAKEKPESLTSTTYEPGQGSTSELAQYEGIPASEVVSMAKKEVDDILDEIAIEMLSGESGEGEKVRIERLKELLDPKNVSNTELFANINPKKEYTVVKKEPHRNSFIYTIIDDAGKEVKLTGRYAKPVGAMFSNTLALGKSYKEAFIEALRLMLQYGQMLPKYNKTVYFPSPTEAGVWSRKDVGSNVVKTAQGDIALPYKRTKDGNYKRYKNIDEVPMTYTWDSAGKLAGNTEKIIDQLSAVALEKNIELPPNLFDEVTKEAKFKTARGAERESLVKETVNFMNSIRLGLRKFFGFTGEESPAIKKDRDFLNGLLKNYEKSQLAEGRIRKAVRELMTERFKKNNKK